MEWWEILLYVLLAAVGGGGIISLIIRSHLEERRAIEERLHGEHRRVYAEILEPYIELFANLSRGGGVNKGIEQKIASKDYRKAIFELGLLGSDGVVRAYNDLMQYFFKLGSGGKQDMYETMRLWGTLRLEIRKSLGNKRTKLSAFDMLRGEIKDIDKFLNEPRSKS